MDELASEPTNELAGELINELAGELTNELAGEPTDEPADKLSDTPSATPRTPRCLTGVNDSVVVHPPDRTDRITGFPHMADRMPIA